MSCAHLKRHEAKLATSAPQCGLAEQVKSTKPAWPMRHHQANWTKMLRDEPLPEPTLRGLSEASEAATAESTRRAVIGRNDRE